MATWDQSISPKAKEVLRRNAEVRQRDGRFIKIEPGEKKFLTFNPEKIEQVEAEYKIQIYNYRSWYERSGGVVRSRKENF